MPNNLFRQRALSLIEAAKREFLEITEIDHPGLRGRVREIAVERLIRPFLPAPFDIGTGKIVDANGKQSSETDVIIYSRDILPSIMYSERDGLFPIESTFFSIEIKSRLTSVELNDAIKKAERLAGLDYLYGYHTDDAQQVEHKFMTTMPLLFAFDSDLTVEGKDELQRYMEKDIDWLSSPKLKAICVLGRGMWLHDNYNRRWHFHPPSKEHDEVLDWLSILINTLPKSRITRGFPRLGNYLMKRRKIKWADGE